LEDTKKHGGKRTRGCSWDKKKMRAISNAKKAEKPVFGKEEGGKRKDKKMPIFHDAARTSHGRILGGKIIPSVRAAGMPSSIPLIRMGDLQNRMPIA